MSKCSCLRKYNPRTLRKYINRFNRSSTDISLTNFVEHFKYISNTAHTDFVPDHGASLRDETLHIDERGCQFCT